MGSTKILLGPSGLQSISVIVELTPEAFELQRLYFFHAQFYDEYNNAQSNAYHQKSKQPRHVVKLEGLNRGVCRHGR